MSESFECHYEWVMWVSPDFLTADSVSAIKCDCKFIGFKPAQAHAHRCKQVGKFTSIIEDRILWVQNSSHTLVSKM